MFYINYFYIQHSCFEGDKRKSGRPGLVFVAVLARENRAWIKLVTGYVREVD
jgi:hypothetical protein